MPSINIAKSCVFAPKHRFILNYHLPLVKIAITRLYVFIWAEEKMSEC